MARQHSLSMWLFTGFADIPNSLPTETSKLKGRARKLARDAAQNQSSNRSKSTLEGSKYLVAMKDFTTLAQWIVNSMKPRIEVPASFMSVLNRAIAVRKRHYHWWNRQSETSIDSNSTKSQANDSHAYFIGVLEEVRRILQLRTPAEVVNDPSAQSIEETSTSKAAYARVVNLFENLEPEEPSEAYLNSESASTSQKPTSSSDIRYGVEQAQSLEEVHLAVHCLFNDFDNIRRYLQQVWIGYKHGAFDLIAASITTNTAIDFAKRLHEDFLETFPKHADFERHINVFYALLCSAVNQAPESKERPDDEMNFAVYNDAETLLFPAYMLVSAFNRILEPGSLPVYKPGHYGVYDPLSDRASKSSRDKFREDKIILLELLPDFYVFSLTRGKIPAEDEMTRGIREMAAQNKVPIWLAFAAQVFLDIHHILREQIGRGRDDLVKSAKYVESGIERVLDFHKNLRIENWPKSNDQGLLMILDRIMNWVKTDAVGRVKEGLTNSSEIQSTAVEPFLLLRNHPLYCGLLSYSIRILAQEASIVFANAWGSVLYCAHLYNALYQEKLMTNRWHDMDLILLMHRTDTIFVGNFPKTADDYLKRFALSMGYSATAFARNKRRQGLTASKSGPRGLNDISPVSQIFKTRYCDDEDRTNLSPDDVDLILKEHEVDIEDADQEESDEWTTPRIKINVAEETPSTPVAEDVPPSESESHKKKIRKSATTGVRPIQLLNSLLNAIQSEMVELTFNHFRMHTFSWRLLRNLKEELDADLRDIYGPGYLERENQLPFLVGYIFMTGAQTSRLEGLLAPKKKVEVSNRLLEKAASVVNLMLATGAGRIEHQLLKDYMDMELETPDILEVALTESESPIDDSTGLA